MRLDDKHMIKSVVADRVDLPAGCMHGDIYDSLEQMRAEHPHSEPMFGHVVVDARTGKIPKGYSDWYETAAEAYGAWRAKNAKPFKLTLAYDGKDTMTVDYHDGSDGETYIHVDTLAEIQRVAADAVNSAAGPEAD